MAAQEDREQTDASLPAAYLGFFLACLALIIGFGWDLWIGARQTVLGHWERSLPVELILDYGALLILLYAIFR